jgi:hypothetical protein
MAKRFLATRHANQKQENPWIVDSLVGTCLESKFKKCGVEVVLEFASSIFAVVVVSDRI